MPGIKLEDQQASFFGGWCRWIAAMLPGSHLAAFGHELTKAVVRTLAQSGRQRPVCFGVGFEQSHLSRHADAAQDQALPRDIVLASNVLMEDILRLNQRGWDLRVEEQDVWTRPVSPEQIERARSGDWSLVLTPNRPVPRHWFGDVIGRDILCLASGGGQQAPILAAAGARVTVLDASAKQLDQDAMVAAREGLELKIVQGFMHDLSAFASASFDLVFHPASNCFAPEIEPVWRECYRVLRPHGALLTGFMNPDVYIFDYEAQARGELIVRHPLPFAENRDLSKDELNRLLTRDHVVEFSHSLEEQIGGQLRAGFVLTDMFEDRDYGLPEAGRSKFMPTLFATRASKPRSD